MVMEACCDLEVDVNGEGIFMADKSILSCYCGKLSKLFGKSTDKKRNLKVIFHNFPGSLEGFELIAKFCYNGGVIKISPSNIMILNCASRFMEMESSVSGMDNLVEQIAKSLEDISYYTWSDLLVALKQNQDLALVEESSDLVQKLLTALVGIIAVASAEATPCPSTCSPESSGFRISCDSRSTESLKTSSSRASWWFEDLLALDLELVQMAVKCMISRKLEHAIVGKFLLYYQKVKSMDVELDDKCKIIETVIENLCSFDHVSVSCKGLFMLLRAALNVKIKKEIRMALESLVGSRLDETTLDNLLMPAPNGVKSLYDVSLVLRLIRVFRNAAGVCKASHDRMKKVADLLDLFLAEVAPDPYLKPSKLIALAVALPDSARESYDEMYHAIDTYLQVHTGLTDEERLNVCCVLNYEKLSPETCLRLSENKKFSSRSAVQALLYHQSKLNDLLGQEHCYTPRSSYDASPFNYADYGSAKRKEETGVCQEQVAVYGEKLDVEAENEKLRAQLQGMQCRVIELEKDCRKMKTQMRKIMKSSRSLNGIRSRSLPKLCS